MYSCEYLKIIQSFHIFVYLVGKSFAVDMSSPINEILSIWVSQARRDGVLVVPHSLGVQSLAAFIMIIGRDLKYLGGEFGW